MRKISIFLLLSCALCACDLLGGGPSATGVEACSICLKFSEPSYEMTKASTQLQIDTNSFILTVAKSNGDVMYSGRYSDSPESMLVDPGTYNVKVVSTESQSPAFDVPVWGDEQLVVVGRGDKVLVELVCTQVNCGVRLNISPQFLTSFPSSSLLLKSDAGKLTYGYREKRTAYFPAGKVSLVMSTGATDETLLTRNIAGGDILCLNISVPSASESGGGVRIQVDTARNYVSETVVLGEDARGKGDTPDNAYTISQARDAVGQEDVWVAGYIVGGDLSQSSVSFQGPFKSATNLAIGPRSTVGSRDSCMSVELKSGDVRDALNLVAHPDMLGRFVYLKGDINPSYYGLVGIKNITDYQF